MCRHHCFPPVGNDDTRIIILGSLPGRASLDAMQYYAHPRNQFWRLLADILQVPDLPKRPYSEKIACLLGNGIGLWDVVQSAERRGSLDANLREVRYNGLMAFLAEYPRLQAVGLNGRIAAAASRQWPPQTWQLLQLPSSSPAHTMAYDDKLAQWRLLERYL